MSDTPVQCPPNDTTEPKCKPLVTPDPPKLPDPEECPQPCCCPPPPGGDGFACLTDLIRDQSNLAEQAATAKAFADALRALQDKAIEARAQYTRTKFEALKKTWTDQDSQIAALAHQVGCTVKCWRCLLECRLCELLYDIRSLERQLHGTGVFHDKVDTLQELAQWHERNLAERQAVFDRIKAILSAWEDTVKNLEDALERNKALIEAIKSMISSEPAAAIYALFVKLIPTHVAIQPRDKDGKPTTTIDPMYIDLCDCDEDEVDDCCGPNTGLLSVRHRLIPPLPYLVDPDKFFEVLCCLIKERYLKANAALAKAGADYEVAKQDVERVTALIKAKTGSLEADFKAELSGRIDCDKYWKKSGPDDPCTKRPEPETPKPDSPKQGPLKPDAPQQSGA